MVKITLKLERLVNETHDIVVENNLTPQAVEYLKKTNLASRYIIITDAGVKPADGKLYAVSLQEALRDAGIKSNVFIIKTPGEQSKTIDECKLLWNQLAKYRCGRDTALIGVGGGVVTDLTGFVASTYVREVPHILYPTTLLAMVDAAIGGKTGADLEEGKNMVGRIQQPKAVFSDPLVLKSLPGREFTNGLGEVVKYGLIADEPLFRYLQQNADKILARDEATILHIIKESCRIKAAIVEQDPNEKGLRSILNYGHTIGHALEKLAGYDSSEWPHGFSISPGMGVDARIAIMMGHYSREGLAEQEQLQTKLGLPIKIPARFSDNDAIIEATMTDKKASKGIPRYPIVMHIGKMCSVGNDYLFDVSRETVLKALDQTR